jgi:hypothetical protein
MKKFASIFLLFSILVICISFSQYIKYFQDYIENYTNYADYETAYIPLNLVPSKEIKDLPPELQAQQTQFYTNRQ